MARPWSIPPLALGILWSTSKSRNENSRRQPADSPSLLTEQLPLVGAVGKHFALVRATRDVFPMVDLREDAELLSETHLYEVGRHR